MADSYAKEQKLAGSFFNNVQPNSTSIDTLASLKALQHFYNPNGTAEEKSNHKAISAIAQEEARWQLAGIQALSSSRILQEKLGTGYQASAIAGQLIKQKMAQSVYDQALQNAIQSSGVKALKLGANAQELLDNSTSLINR